MSPENKRLNAKTGDIKDVKTPIQRITGEGNGDLVFDFLTKRITSSDLQSLLLTVFEQRVAKLGVSDLSSEYRENRFVRPSKFDQRKFAVLEQSIYQNVVSEDFEAVELSPVNPLGLNFLIAGTDQKNILSTIRGVEVLSDITTALALECAKRRKKNPYSSVKLCTNHRSLRLQKYEEETGFSPHFKAFGMCSSGRDSGHEKFEKESLNSHIETYIQILIEGRKLGYKIGKIKVSISDIGITEALLRKKGIEKDNLGKQIRQGTLKEKIAGDLPSHVARLEDISLEKIVGLGVQDKFEKLGKLGEVVFGELRRKYPLVDFFFELTRVEGIGYYQNFCFKIEAQNENGETYQLADGGFTDWTQILLSDKKERILTSGIGTEFLLTKFSD